jgi:hypothetical protein
LRKNTLLGLLAAALAVGSLSACGSTTGDSSTSGGSSSDGSSKSSKGSSKASKKSSKADDGCGSKATDDCTPHMTGKQSVRVDALIWSVKSAKTASGIGDQTYGAGATATGRFVIVKIGVHSDKNESATLSDEAIKLEVGGNTYDADNDGTVAASLDGQDPFFLNTIGPDADRTGIVVFDVPKKVLSKKVEVRFNEMGFGETHGYIALPSLSSSASS